MDTSKQMPNLMGAAHGAANGNRRILAQLEYGPKATSPARAWSFDGWTVGLVLLLLTLGGVAWLMHEETITPVTFKRHVQSRDTAVTPAPNTVGATAATATDAMPAPSAAPAVAYADSSDAHAERPAAIINQPRLAVSALSGALASTPAGQRNMASDPPGTSTKIDKAAKVTNTAGNHNSTATAHGTRPGSRPVAPVANDTDVTLLTALVAHAGKPASVAPEPSRDVVERVDGVSTADLLARCRQLGLMEGMLCRSRICSGGWESDPVCRASAN